MPDPNINPSGVNGAPPPGQGQVQAPPATPDSVPGLGFIDGLMSIVCAPGRGLVRLYKSEPDSSDLPLILILSALAWGGAYWVFNRYVLDDGASTYRPKPRRRKVTVFQKGRPKVSSQSVPMEEDLDDEEGED